jgi:hypothetical protein
MEQRAVPRFAADQAVWVKLLGKVKTRIRGRIRNISGRGMGIEVGQAIPPGTPLQFEVSDSLLLGEAVFCRAEGEQYYVGAELEHALYGLAGLAKALQEFSRADSLVRAGPSGPAE